MFTTQKWYAGLKFIASLSEIVTIAVPIWVLACTDIKFNMDTPKEANNLYN